MKNFPHMHRKWLLLLPVLGIVLISGTLDLDRLFNYADQPVPDYITRDNTLGNDITDEIATLGRVEERENAIRPR